jgi:hypothetical protein
MFLRVEELSVSIRINALNEGSFYNSLVFLSGYDKSTTNFIMISFKFYAFSSLLFSLLLWSSR